MLFEMRSLDLVCLLPLLLFLFLYIFLFFSLSFLLFLSAMTRVGFFFEEIKRWQGMMLLYVLTL